MVPTLLLLLPSDADSQQALTHSTNPSALTPHHSMVRLAARICFALVLIAAASITTHAATAVQWEDDYKSWMEDIKVSVAGNADLEKKAAELQTQLDAAIAAGVPEEDRMRLLYDFLRVVDSDPTFVGFSTKEATASTPSSSPAATTASVPAPTPSSAASSLSLVSMATIAVAVVGYALL